MFNASGCKLDGVSFPLISTNNIPCGFASVPVKVNDNGNEFDTVMVAGLVGIQASPNHLALDQGSDIKKERHESSDESPLDAPAKATEEIELNSIQAVSGWWMYGV